MKALSIIAISLSAIFLFWLFAAININGGLTLEEFAPGAVIFTLYSLAFSIVATVVSFKKKKQQ